MNTDGHGAEEEEQSLTQRREAKAEGAKAEATDDPASLGASPGQGTDGHGEEKEHPQISRIARISGGGNEASRNGGAARIREHGKLSLLLIRMIGVIVVKFHAPQP